MDLSISFEYEYRNTKGMHSIHTRDDHYPVCWLDIRQDSKFATE